MLQCSSGAVNGSGKSHTKGDYVCSWCSDEGLTPLCYKDEACEAYSTYLVSSQTREIAMR